VPDGSPIGEQTKVAGHREMNPMPLSFSIVIPNFNSGPVLERAIQSLMAQNYPDLQIILMDGGSTDESRQTIEKYRNVLQTVVIEKDKGQTDALNKGFALARGDIHGWLCADDELIPGALREVARVFAENSNADVVTGACERVFADGSRLICPPDSDPWQKINVQNVIEQSATFWRASLHQRVGAVAMNFHLAFDWDLWNRFRKSGAKIVTTGQLLSRYYFSATNKTGSAGRIFVDEAIIILRRYGPLGGALAYIYLFLYQQFDLHGCYDKPPTCTLVRSHFFIWTLAILRVVIGERLLYLYNWHFAACQERGLKWW
jgi:glycosyltransferase involved in cell wall biosynthesis